ncbi:molybdopterin molybdenumtransferase MoeA [Edaphobacter acidisoli]|uniref:Molybdopterin molybdenumtransferase n=1 Tax=Edaphobacter acidisoli TaxID=2040573 RepID=A0A916W819_9BACT|nr:gephyrin-like molybdotransferase Glp [Edaphobacter acidisoli]GGA75503.1 molybdopterin molybdenumtransferase MoeA [Edaphobacter acidisoli]
MKLETSEYVAGFDEALEMVLHWAVPIEKTGVERLALLDCVDRVLAEDVAADRDQPPFARSARDGFAVRAADAVAGAELVVAGLVRAGEQWGGPALVRGSAIEIMTGAPIPDGADAVVMVEHVEQAAGRVRMVAGRSLRSGENVVPRGCEARAGDVVLRAGSVMKGAEIALAAACGRASLDVFRRPRVAIVATGDELVGIDAVPEPQQIRNSNSYGLAALADEAGGEAVRFPVARDERAALNATVRAARGCELLLLSGGVSMGKYDLVEEVLRSLGAEFFFTGVKMQPGKPVVFGRLPARDGLREQFFFGLPGNPVSTQVTFCCFVAPLLRAISGSGEVSPRFVQATLAEDVEAKPGLMRVLPARLTSDRTKAEVRLVPWQGSGDMAAHARSNCYAVLPPDQKCSRGDVISLLLR